MNAIVQRSFDSLETSLESLVESVSSYNPSPPAAIAVVNADDILTESLEQRTSHIALNWTTCSIGSVG